MSARVLSVSPLTKMKVLVPPAASEDRETIAGSDFCLQKSAFEAVPIQVRQTRSSLILVNE